MKHSVFVLVCFFLTACAPVPAPVQTQASTPVSVELYDAERGRQVPIILYRPSGPGPHRLAILSHGYGGAPDAYGFLARSLVARGWLVAAIDHELDNDAPMPTEGEPRVVRMPNWRVGADSIGFVIAQMTARREALDGSALLVGHSNGGDMAMLFAGEHPDRVFAVISLDNRRMPLPRESRFPILTLRSSDQVADTGVLPSPDEAARFRIQVVPVSVPHNDMWDGASDAQRAEMLAKIEEFLADNGG